MVTSFYIGIYILYFVMLSINVIRCRRSSGVAIGDGGDSKLLTRIRAQANFAEYAPLFLIGVLMIENYHASTILIHVLCIVFLFGRILHTYSVAFAEIYKNGKLLTSAKFRVIGMAITFTCLISTATILIALSLWS